MEPERTGRATLVDLLDKILDKGLVLNADLVISLAGVPLLAVSLNAAISSVETMQRYGLMRDLIKPKVTQKIDAVSHAVNSRHQEKTA